LTYNDLKINSDRLCLTVNERDLIIADYLIGFLADVDWIIWWPTASK